MLDAAKNSSSLKNPYQNILGFEVCFYLNSNQCSEAGEVLLQGGGGLFINFEIYILCG